jgi:hypothetical protein
MIGGRRVIWNLAGNDPRRPSDGPTEVDVVPLGLPYFDCCLWLIVIDRSRKLNLSETVTHTRIRYHIRRNPPIISVVYNTDRND